MIVTNVKGLRDPFMLVDDGVYYLYGTGVLNKDWDNTTWDCYVNDSGSLSGEWKKTEKLIYQNCPIRSLAMDGNCFWCVVPYRNSCGKARLYSCCIFARCLCKTR